jgi:micrococcal nuclease
MLIHQSPQRGFDLLRRVAFIVALACGNVATAASAQDGYAASSKGTVYYWTGCNAWKRLSKPNLIFFDSAEAARQAGYKPSRSPGCAGPELDNAIMNAMASGERCVVEKVVDGDSFRCAPFGAIRLLLIDTPELKQKPYGALARRTAQRLLVVGDTVELEFDVQRRDRYKRLLAYVYLRDGRMVNRELLRAGVAIVSVHPPNVKYVERMRAASDSAKAEKRGLWSGPAFECTPADFRAKRCT